jgi:NADP-dependent 3-hydroxy acid dehydrogenase YdfG
VEARNLEAYKEGWKVPGRHAFANRVFALRRRNHIKDVKERFMHFKDKVAIVTRGSSGIRKETAKRLVAHGASVLSGGRREAKLQSVAAEIGGNSGKVCVFAGGISSPAAGAAFVESAERHFDGLDKFGSGTRWPSFTTQGGGR